MDVKDELAAWLQTEGSVSPLLLVTDSEPTLSDYIPDSILENTELVAAPAEDKLQIEHIRELLQQLETRHVSGNRLVWIPDAHRLLSAAANALLKTLEDTQRMNRFLLTTPYPGRLLATIRSRTRIIRIPRTPSEVSNLDMPVFDPKRKTPLDMREAATVAAKLQERISQGHIDPGTARSLMRLRDYYKAVSQGVGQRAASDALLASLDDDVY